MKKEDSFDIIVKERVFSIRTTGLKKYQELKRMCCYTRYKSRVCEFLKIVNIDKKYLNDSLCMSVFCCVHTNPALPCRCNSGTWGRNMELFSQQLYKTQILNRFCFKENIPGSHSHTYKPSAVLETCLLGDRAFWSFPRHTLHFQLTFIAKPWPVWVRKFLIPF